MSSNSFAERLLLNDVSCVFLIQSKNEADEPVFAYVAVTGAKLGLFQFALKQPLFDAAMYGDILLTGEGSPTEKDQKYMAERYGFNHKDMQHITLG